VALNESPNSTLEQPKQIERWIRLARTGDIEALHQLFKASRNYLWTVAHQELTADLRPKVAPSDLVQETLMEAHRDFPGFTGQEQRDLLAWLRRILLNNLANAQRKYRGTEKRSISREVGLGGIDSATGDAVDLPHSDASPSSIACSKEQEIRLEAAIQRLLPDYRSVILLRHRDHLPFEEIARHLGRSVVATRKLWSRAIERLQRELEVDDE
jgi:RNA polymerase sigma-70 factor (ECF subfamily)